MLDKLLKPLVPYLPENNRLERIWILAKFDFKSRYYYHSLGVLWASIRPLVEFILYFVVFTKLFQIDIPHFALYLSLGLIIWYFFAEATSKGISVLLNKRYLIENIPFNRLDLFLSINFSALWAFVFNFLAFLFFSLCLGVIPIHPMVIYFPILILNLFLLTVGVSLILSTISIYLKDIQHLWDMLLIIGMWGSPILYDNAILEKSMPFLLYMHPVSGIIMNMRAILIYGNNPDFLMLIYNFIYALVILDIGYLVFTQYSHKAVEKI